MWEAVEAGLTEISHFEEIGLLREGIGADRVSDATAAILRKRFIAYTEAICKQYDVATETFNFQKGSFDIGAGRWVPVSGSLPRNVYNNKGILLVPQRYLRELPTVNAYDFWDYCVGNENAILRNEFNYDVATRAQRA